MKTLLTISMLLITLSVMATDKIAAYYDDDREDNGKIIGEWVVCYYKSPFKKGKEFDIFRLFPAAKECPLVVYLGDSEDKKSNFAQTEPKVEKK